MSVNVFSTKVLIGDTNGRDRHFTWSSEPREGPAACRAKGVPSFLRYFKALSIGPALGIEPATSCSAVKRSTDSANPAAVECECVEYVSQVGVNAYHWLYVFPRKRNACHLELFLGRKIHSTRDMR